MKKYLVSYFRNGIAKTDTVILYKEGLEKLGDGNIGLKLIEELTWLERAGIGAVDVVLINFWEVTDET